MSALDIRVDPRIELLAAVQLLAGYENLAKQESPYKTRLRDYFSPYAKTQAVRIFEDIIKESTYSDAYPDFALRLSDPPELSEHAPFHEYIDTAFRGRTHEFLDATRSFAAKSNFTCFFNREVPFYHHLIESCRETLGKCDDIRIIGDYFGLRKVAHSVILSPLMEGGVGLRLKNQAGQLQAFCVVGPTLYGKPIRSSQVDLSELIWHELSHPFVNPVTAKYETLLRESEDLFAPLRERLGNYGYRSWKTCVNEHVIRAITTRIATIQLGAQVGEDALRREMESGFPYVGALYQRLEEYEANRERFPDLESFYPNLMGAFKHAS